MDRTGATSAINQKNVVDIFNLVVAARFIGLF
jgi:hypothetical protein